MIDTTYEPALPVMRVTALKVATQAETLADSVEEPSLRDHIYSARHVTIIAPESEEKSDAVVPSNEIQEIKV